MSNSADKPAAIEGNLEEDSDVIELTEEVQATAGAMEPASEIDVLGFEMPEFKLPTAEPYEYTSPEELISKNLEDRTHEAQAIDRSGDHKDTDVLPAAEVEKIAATSGAKEPESAPAYDREAMVKTIQMDAIDRSQFEQLRRAQNDVAIALLGDQRFAPDMLVSPPRVLIKRWQEGAPEASKETLAQHATLLAARNAKASAATVEAPESETLPPEVSETTELDAVDLESVEWEAQELDSAELEAVKLEPEGEAAATAKQPDAEPITQVLDPNDVDLPEVLPEALELDSDAIEIEVAGQNGPPPKPRVPKQSAPPKAASPAPSNADPEMQELVQELLEEQKSAAKATQRQAKTRPRDVWFQKVFTEEYLRTMPGDVEAQTRRDVDFILASMALKKDARILDLACGFGRHSIELCTRGYEQVVGLDLSKPLLEKALNDAKKRSLAIKFIQGDMRDLNFTEIFDACFLWNTSLGYFDDRANLRMLQGVNRALKPGGRFLVDVVNRDHAVAEMPSRTWWEGVECIFLEEVEFDYNTSVIHAKRSFIYEDGSPPLEQNSYIRLYSLHELRQMLGVAGFSVQEVSGARHHRGQFLGPDSARLIVMAEKRTKS